MNIVETDQCTLCKQTRETVPHLLYECVHAQTIWNRIITTWFSKVGIHSLTEKEIFFGVAIDNIGETFLNHLLTAAKFYIYKCRVTEQPVSFIEFCAILRNTEQIEMTIAVSTGKERKHNLKWSLLNE